MLAGSGWREPRTVVLFGAVHVGLARRRLVCQRRRRTPLGDLKVDAELAQACAGRDPLCARRSGCPAQTHAIEVANCPLSSICCQLHAFCLLRAAKAEAPKFGRAVARAVQQLGRCVVALASTISRTMGALCLARRALGGRDGLDP